MSEEPFSDPDAQKFSVTDPVLDEAGVRARQLLDGASEFTEQASSTFDSEAFFATLKQAGLEQLTPEQQALVDNPAAQQIFGALLSKTTEQAQTITEQASKIGELESQIGVDKLTGLLDRRGFDDLLAHYIEHAAPNSFGVLFFDITGFKKLNDTLGHEQGDAFLQDFADFLRANFRRRKGLPHDEIAREGESGRHGGDEFAVLVSLQPSRDPDTDMLRTPEQLLGLIKDKTYESFGLFMQEHPDFSSIDVAVGGAVFNGQPQKELMRAADEDMYAHKAQQHATYGNYR